MAKTYRQESHKSRKGESDAHKIRRDYRETLDFLRDVDDEDLEELDLDTFNKGRSTYGPDTTKIKRRTT